MGEKGSVSLIVRLHYADGKTEDHPLHNGIHFADYIRRIDVPESEFAFSLRNQQMRYLTIEPKRAERIERIEKIEKPERVEKIERIEKVERPTKPEKVEKVERLEKVERPAKPEKSVRSGK